MSTEMDMTPDQVWNETLEIIKQQIPLQSFNTWLKPTCGVYFDKKTIKVSAPNKFAAGWVAEKYNDLILDALNKRLGSSVKVEYVSGVEKNTDSIPVHDNSSIEISSAPAKTNYESQLSSRYRFENFVVGDSNQFAHAAALAVAKAPMQTKYNPLYIYGGVGLGKTHLAQALGNQVRDGFSNLKVLYVTSEKFTTDFIDAIGHQRTAEFAKLYRGVDLLLLDDIQFLTGKEATQEQFFHTFNALHQAGKQIVLTSDRSPREIKGLEERLLSRFQCGLVADIQPPELETRIAILQQIVVSEKRSISFDVLTYIARNITRNIRELEGSIIRLLAYGSLTGRELNISFTQEILRDSLRTDLQITPEAIIKAVSAYFRLDQEQLKSKKKTSEIVRARQIAMHLCRKLTSGSLKSIGELFGGRDHSTVIHALEVIDHELQIDLSLQTALADIEKSLRLH